MKHNEPNYHLIKPIKIFLLAIPLLTVSLMGQTPSEGTGANGTNQQIVSVKLPEIDLVAAKLNGSNIFNLSVDFVTDLLGRPSSVESSGERAAVTLLGRTLPGFKWGPQLRFEDLGLHFQFEHPDVDPAQKCIALTIYLSEQREPIFSSAMNRQSGSCRYAPYKGTLSKRVDAHWKAKRVLEEFAKFNPKDKAEDEQLRTQDAVVKENAQKALKQVQGTAAQSRVAPLLEKDARNGMIEQRSIVTMSQSSHTVDFHYDWTTKFLEKIRVYQRDGE